MTLDSATALVPCPLSEAAGRKANAWSSMTPSSTRLDMVRYCHQTAIRLPSDFRLIRLSEQPVNGVSVCVRENKTAPLTESLLSLATSFGMIFAGNGKVDKSNSSIYLQVLHEGDEARTVLLAGSSQRIPICFTYQFFIVLHQSRPNLPRDIMLRIESPKSIDFMSP